MMLKAAPLIATLPSRVARFCCNAAALAASPLPFEAFRWFGIDMTMGPLTMHGYGGRYAGQRRKWADALVIEYQVSGTPYFYWRLPTIRHRLSRCVPARTEQRLTQQIGYGPIGSVDCSSARARRTPGRTGLAHAATTQVRQVLLRFNKAELGCLAHPERGRDGGIVLAPPAGNGPFL
jgi:hypothetical protein